MFKKILIANRGEIALRIMRACQELGVKTVAIYSDVDAESLHVKFADEAICVGPAHAEKSYLNIPAIIEAAKQKGADGIHPGYGFLAENAGFAEACKKEDIVFIGPDAKTMDLLGDKINARATAKMADIPLLPGSEAGVETKEDCLKIAEEIGYPVILKASSGGGGKGLQIINKPADFEKFSVTQEEVKAAFGSGDMFLEKYCTNPKHVEVQILADKHGNTLVLGERDCSIQRKHQKLLEETPCSTISPSIRERLFEAAVRLSKAANYHSAGTVEFLVDNNESFYFLEMNTRIQVEHPVSEMISGVDILKEQIKIAAGQELEISQKELKLNGHSIECRINAEDAFTFTPSPGKIDFYNAPGGIGVRVDTCIYSGYKVLPFYDSLIAKVIVWGSTRGEAISRMQRALNETSITGIKTNIPFQKKLLGAPVFRDGSYTTTCLNSITK